MIFFKIIDYSFPPGSYSFTSFFFAFLSNTFFVGSVSDFKNLAVKLLVLYKLQIKVLLIFG